MSGADTFSSFLERLEAHWEDSGRVGDAAGDLFVSRSVLDRLVVAAAGEPPARLCRRLLLERAAHRLKRTTDGILEVAISAGYSSHEAFTRSFARAYGAPPQVWRVGGGSFRLPSPSSIHFQPPAGLRFPGRALESTMNFLHDILTGQVSLIGRMIDAAGQLDAVDLDRPIETSVPTIDESPTIRSLLSRLVGQLEMWTNSTSNESYDFSVEENEDLASLRARLERVGPRFLALTDPESAASFLSESFIDATCDPSFEYTGAGMVGHILTYGSYRRTLAVGALEAATGQSLHDDPLGWFTP